jgi:hypothetical protein
MRGDLARDGRQQTDAYPRANQAADRRQLVTLASNRECHHRSCEHIIGERSLPIAGPGRDERLASKVFDRDLFATGKAVGWRNGEKDYPRNLTHRL